MATPAAPLPAPEFARPACRRTHLRNHDAPASMSCRQTLSSPSVPPRPRLHHAWIVAGVTFLTLLAAAGSRSASGVLILPLGNAFQWSRATVPPTVRLTADVFGRENGGIVYGWVAASHQLGAAFATSAAGILRTTTGTYTLAFIGAGALCMIAALGVLPIGKKPARETPALV